MSQLRHGHLVRTCVKAMAGMTDKPVLVDIRSQRQKAAGRHHSTKSLLISSALSSFHACAKVLREQAGVWLGVGWIAAALGMLDLMRNAKHPY